VSSIRRIDARVTRAISAMIVLQHGMRERRVELLIPERQHVALDVKDLSHASAARELDHRRRDIGTDQPARVPLREDTQIAARAAPDLEDAEALDREQVEQSRLGDLPPVAVEWARVTRELGIGPPLDHSSRDSIPVVGAVIRCVGGIWHT